MKRFAVFAVATLSVLTTALPAAAAEFNVKPIRVFLSKDTGSTILTVENQAPNVLRLQVRAYAWSNDSHGQPVLAPSDDLIVFPTLIDVKPMEHRSIRIGFSGEAAAKELTYRIALDELPSLESQISPQKQVGLEVRTRITVPVFFTPLITTSKGRLDEPVMSHGVINDSFSNLGNVHATVSSAEIVARDSSGAEVFEKRINGWYVLAGQSWQIGANVPSNCSRVKTVSVTVQSDIGRFSRTALAPTGACR
ncbi:MAG: fimbrial biogenesis chaperone [Vulcanimicrobiaceae bacterium]